MADEKQPIGVNFVCQGNICRSPMAEAVFQHMVNTVGLSASFRVASSAVGDWHVGQRPHPGTQTVLSQNRIPIDPEKRAMLIRSLDFNHYRYILAVDQETAADIHMMYGHKVKRLMEYAVEGLPLDVPDPYYNHKFAQVYELVSAACQGLLHHIREVERI